MDREHDPATPMRVAQLVIATLPPSQALALARTDTAPVDADDTSIVDVALDAAHADLVTLLGREAADRVVSAEHVVGSICAVERPRWRDTRGVLYEEHERCGHHMGDRVDLRTLDGEVREVDFVASLLDRGWTREVSQ